VKYTVVAVFGDRLVHTGKHGYYSCQKRWLSGEWTQVQNLDEILDEFGDFGWTKNDILDSMFVQSLHMSRRKP